MSPLTGVVTEAWYLYRRFAGHFLLISFVIYLITGVLVALLSLAKTPGVIIGDIISFAATYVVQASLIKAVKDVRDGRVDLDLGETVPAASPYILPVIGASILAAIGITIGFILLTFWSLIVPFIVVGGSGVIDSFRNSWRTVRGYAWRVFGTYVLVWLILIAFAIVLGFILILLPLWLRSFVNNVVTGTLVAPFLALVATLIYYRLIAAHAGQPYTTTGPEGATVWEPPYPPTASAPPAPASARSPHAPGPLGPSRPLRPSRPLGAVRAHGPRPQGRHAPLLHATRTHATAPRGARPLHPAGVAPTASRQPLTPASRP